MKRSAVSHKNKNWGFNKKFTNNYFLLDDSLKINVTESKAICDPE